MTQLILRCLGPLQVLLDGILVEGFDSNKVRALLTYLVLGRNHPHSREVLAGLLWPEQSQDSAMGNLRHALADLRRVLHESTNDPPFLMISRDMVQFNPSSDCWMDVIEFEQLTEMRLRIEIDPFNPPVEAFQQAISLYQGSFLEGLSIQRSAPFEEWMLNVREQLHRNFMCVLSSLAGHFERAGELQLALDAALKQVKLEPWLEEAHQQIMRLLSFEGKRSAALVQYQTCKDILRKELGIETSDQTKRLYEKILHHTLHIPPHLKQAFQLPEAEQGKAGATHFFAREKELELLDNCLEASFSGKSQVLLIIGEPGSGKTSLVKEFIRRSIHQSPSLLALYTNCNAITGISDPYLPFIEILAMLTGDVERSWGLFTEDTEVVTRLWSGAAEAIQAVVEYGPDIVGRFLPGEELLARANVLPQLGTDRLEKLIDKNRSGLAQTIPGSGEIKQSAMFEQLGRILKEVSSHHPLILAIDDLQWADANTINLLFFLCRRLISHRVMLLLIYRDEEVTDYRSGKSTPLGTILRELQASNLGQKVGLSQSAGHQSIRQLVDNQPNLLGETFRDTLEQLSVGIPLFAIELLQAMKNQGGLQLNSHGLWIEAESLNWNHLPPRVEAAIAEQVNHLDFEWQTVLKAASIEGDGFSAETVARVLSLDPHALISQLSGLIAQQHRLIVSAGVGQIPGGEQYLSHYRFRHHIYQEYFYSHQDSIERAHLHKAIGDSLEVLYGDQKHEISLALAHHFECAGNSEKAATYLLHAGKKAASLFANESALALFRRGLNLIDTIPSSPKRDQLELDLLIALSAPLINTAGYTSSELEGILTRGQKLIKRNKDAINLFWVLSFFKSQYNIRGDPVNSKEMAAQILKLAQLKNDSGWLVVAHSRMVSNCLYYGRWSSLQKHLKEAIRLYDNGKHAWIIHQLGSDPIGNALSYAAIGAWITGFPLRAQSYSQRSLELARDHDHPMVSWFADYYAAHLQIYLGEPQQARLFSDAALNICEEHDLAYYRVHSQALSGWILVQTGEHTGINLLEQSVSQLRQVGDRLNLLLLLRLFACACLQTGNGAQALNLIEEAIDLSHSTQVVYDLPELLRLKSEILSSLDPDETGILESSLIKAIECAIQYKTRMWELRTTTDLAQLWLKQGKVNEARSRLTEIYGWFHQGFDTRDLRNARSILDQLG